MNVSRSAGPAFIGLATLSLIGGGSFAAPPRVPADRALMLRDWILLGPISAPQRLLDGEDYLAAIGGEAGAVLHDGQIVPIRDGTGKDITLTARRVSADGTSVLDFLLHIPNMENGVAYAYTEFESRRAEKAAALLGSDDWAQMWLNGQKVYDRAGPGGRSLTRREDIVPITLKKGRNTVLVKVDQASGAWGISLEIAPRAEADRLATEQAARARIRRFQGMELGPQTPWMWNFPPGPFPAIAWKDPTAAEVGAGPPHVRWFNADANEVKTAEKPGRYIAYIEADGPDGVIARRALTLFCRPDAPAVYEEPSLPLGRFPFAPENPPAWNALKPAFEQMMGRETARMLATTETGPIWLASLSEPRPRGIGPSQMDWPETDHLDHHLTVKLKVLDARGRFGALAPPRRRATPAPVLRAGTPAEAGMAPDAADRIRAACRAWNGATGIPFTAFVARNGVIVFHEAFGNAPDGPATIAAKYPIASVTKTHTGLMFAQFLDQGLISLDDPVGKFLPGFVTEGPKALTLRHCFTNTSGLEGHGEFGGMMNPWLDNTLANGMGPLEPGKVYIYNGMGYDLAGRVMEVVSGKSIFRLMHENFFVPLGQDDPTMVDMAYGLTCTGADLGRVGQLMLNKGSYGDVEFFSERTFDDQVRPRPLETFFPNIGNYRDLAYNMGMQYPTDDDVTVPALGKDMLWHGSATGAILRVVYDKGLVIAMSRPEPGPDYERHLAAFAKSVADGVR